MLKQKINELVEKYIDEVIKHRRYIHSNPELGFEEYKTTKYIQDTLEQHGLKNHKLALKRTKTGVYIDIDSNKPGKTLLFRCDIDALPMQETADVEYKSKNENIAHSCGHDGHTANLLGVAMILNNLKDHFKGKVRLLFQPAEEGPDMGGAIEIVNEKDVLNGVDYALAMHLYGSGQFGKLYFKSGPIYAGFVDFDVVIKSSGGHCSEPHKCPDPIYIGSQLVCEFQSIMTKIKSPLENAVLAIGCFNSGSNPNIIPMEAKLSGTIRTYDFKLADKIVKTMKDMTKAICNIHHAKYETNFLYGYPPVINNDEVTNCIIQSATEFLGSKNIKIIKDAKFGAEDFAFISNQVPSSYFKLGIKKNNEPEPLHHSGDFKWDDSVLKTSLGSCAYMIIDFLNKH